MILKYLTAQSHDSLKIKDYRDVYSYIFLYVFYISQF